MPVQDLGSSAGSKRPTCVILIKPHADYQEAYDECLDEVSHLPKPLWANQDAAHLNSANQDAAPALNLKAQYALISPRISCFSAALAVFTRFQCLC